MSIIEKETIAPLTWCMRIEKETLAVQLIHGSKVEITPEGFVEGAWDGEFTEFQFEQADFLMGSGGKRITTTNEEQFLFATPSHTFERLYAIREEKVLYVSNSLPFILVQSDSSLSRHYFNYEKDLNTILNGLQQVKKWIPLAENKRLQLFYHCNFTVNSQLDITVHQKEAMKPFADFKDYESRLLAALKRLRNNACASERIEGYGLVTTISKGYDSSACAALAREIGCETAVTFDRPIKYADDSGEEVAQQLGYKNILKKDAEAYLENNELLESEFVASGDLGTGIVYAAFEEEFKGNLVFVGHRGDYFWDKNVQDVNDDLRFNDFVFSGTSQAENRLKADYIFVPIPLYGATQWSSLHQVTHLPEMEPYSVGGDYDRPIPRRIVETRGVERQSFGFKKAGAGFNYRYDNAKRLKMRMSSHSFHSFYTYYLDHKRKPYQNIFPWLQYFWNTKRMYSFILLNRIGIEIPFKDIPFDGVSNPGLPSYLFLWGVAKRMEKYQVGSVKQHKSLSETFKRSSYKRQEVVRS
ncbi:hypothetical protein JTF06_07955 [Desemzia sp. RIT804]|uniref:hypothetical protein n=1 Tax=Desemzia sp. RIT 804 TaxID=2810209 RepID=UPI00194DCDD9|nr:hypothetical protein [Desemzia sp. RIT 804]MBM6614823.1 hypothetical protein [Desemzia sp. RIT 804]